MENQSFMQNSNFGLGGNSNEVQPPMPNNYMSLAIVGSILGICSICCIGLILGIISIVFSSQVKSKYNMGDFIGAQKASKNAKILAIIAMILGIIGLIYSIVMLSLNGVDAYMNQYESILNGGY